MTTHEKRAIAEVLKRIVAMIEKLITYLEGKGDV